MKKYDFAGWASKNNVRCADGRTIRQDAFKDNDGQTVPLVWQHRHDDPTNVLGHALLMNKPEGMYTMGAFNDSPLAKHCKMLLEHGDITSLSIYANQLQQSGGDVLHGNIREVSLVLAGANPGASIEYVTLAHGEESETEADIYMDEALELDVEVEETPAEELSELAHADEPGTKKSESRKDEEPMAETADTKEKTVKDVFDTLTEEQKNVVYFMIGKALEDKDGDTEKEEKKDKEEPEMAHNVFEGDTQRNDYLTADDYKAIFANAKRTGSLKEAVMAHMGMEDGDVLVHATDEQGAYLLDHNNQKVRYGVANMDYLFPDYKTLNDMPEFIQRDTEWVNAVMSGAHHTAFSRIKSIFANITMDEARAKGYVKGNAKKEEIFSLLKRTTPPTTVYKKQKLDRDDVIDIVDLDVVAFVKKEMRTMLDEEIARAILVGDGRLTTDDDHISEDCIRPIWKDDATLYTINKVVETGEDDAETAKNFIRQAIKARKDYKGSGNPVLFTTEDMLTEMLLLEDGIGHMLYANQAALATVLRVSRIITVPVMENQTRTVNGHTRTLQGIIVNMKDYNIGADKGGAVNMFDDFDIDYNQMKYLIETRCSGALVKPFSAIVLETEAN